MSYPDFLYINFMIFVGKFRMRILKILIFFCFLLFNFDFLILLKNVLDNLYFVLKWLWGDIDAKITKEKW